MPFRDSQLDLITLLDKVFLTAGECNCWLALRFGRNTLHTFTARETQKAAKMLRTIIRGNNK